MPRPEYLVIITGLSGSGKSYVQSTLEDVGFYCSDNLPIALIEPFLEEVGEHENADRVGIVQIGSRVIAEMARVIGRKAQVARAAWPCTPIPAPFRTRR